MARRSVLLARAASLALLCGLAACGGGTPSWQQARLYRHNAGDYRAPGPPGDPWGPYIEEAAARFSIPARWIRQVMHQESGGHEYLNGGPVTSGAGAMGLMQIMPATYETLRAQYDLGDDPYEPHDNIIAGAGYIRQMYDRFGSPGFLAAYNAGPQRLQDYVDGRSSLPNETVNYVAAIAPNLGSERPTGGPLAAYADAAPVQPRPTPVRYAAALPQRAACPQDPDSAFDAPCLPTTPPDPVWAATIPRPSAPPVLATAAQAGCSPDPDAAYDTACASPAALPPPPIPPQPRRAPVAIADAGCVRDPDAAFDQPCAPPASSPNRVAAATPPTQPGSSLFNTAHAETLPPTARGASVISRDATGTLPEPPEPPRPLEVAALPEPPPPPAALVWRQATPAPNPSVFRPGPLAPPVPRDGMAAHFAPANTLAATALPLPAIAPPPARSVARPGWQAPADPPPLAAAAGAWGIQVGAFADRSLARSQAEAARNVMSRPAGYAATAPTSPFGGAVLYRARLLGLSENAAADACDRLTRARQRCMVVPPGG